MPPTPSMAINVQGSTQPGRGRDSALDILRGLAIVSMVIAHMSMGSLIYTITHVPRWIDAAFVFVAMSGLVLGMVQRRSRDRDDSPAYIRLIRRGGFLYAVQLAILVFALGVRTVSERPAALPAPTERGGWWPALGQAMTLQLPAPNLTILPMYVVLLAVAAPAAAFLLHRRRPLVLVASALAVYAIAFAFPGNTVMPVLAADPAPQFNWAAWQLPFVLGFLVGWYWYERGLRAVLLSRPVLATAAGVWLGCFAAAQAFTRFGVADGAVAGEVAARLFAKFDLGPGTVVFGGATLVALYALVVACGRVVWLRHLLEPVRVLGLHSLDAFIILCVALVALPALLVYDEAGIGGMLAAAVVLIVAWSFARTRGQVRRRGRRSAAPTTPARPA